MNVSWPKIILFGDSQIQRSFSPDSGLWGTLLANRFQRICDVIPRGFSGYTTRSCLNILPKILPPELLMDVKAFVFCVGVNDLSGREEGIPEHVPVKEYCENLAAMIKYLEEGGLNKNKIVLLTPGPYHEEKFLAWCAELGRVLPKRDTQTVVEYVEACMNFGKELGIEVVNVYEEFMKDENWPKYLVDGLHFSCEGARVIYDILLPLLEKRIDTTHWMMPYWRDINPIHPAEVSDELWLKKCPAR